MEAEEEADMKVNSGNNSKINETLHAEPNVNVRTHTRRMFVQKIPKILWIRKFEHDNSGREMDINKDEVVLQACREIKYNKKEEKK